MDTTSPTLPVTEMSAYHERDLVAGRYRLASFHRGDDETEVWRALDEPAHQVVTLEFLRHPDAQNKPRFLAEAHRMALIERPSVMKVSAIHDDPEATFIVFEHLVHVPVALDWLRKALEEPASTAVLLERSSVEPAPTPILKPAPAVVAEAVSASAVIAPVPREPAAVAAVPERASDRGLSGLIDALRARELALIDMALVQEAASEVVALVRTSLEGIDVEAIVERARGLVRVPSIELALPKAPSIHIGLPRIHLPTPRASASQAVAVDVKPAPKEKVREKKPREEKPRQVKVSEPKVSQPKAHGALHVRWRRVLFRGLSLAIIAVAALTVPFESVREAGSEFAAIIGPRIVTAGTQVGTAISEKLAAASPSAPALVHASFDVPPLAAYGAAFEAQSAYPAAKPNETVEWVVALRNTGSAGWYRGIDGAQASLALADGTIAGAQSTAYVGPGQVGWFVVHLRAPAQPGTYQITLTPRIEGRGKLPDLGIFATVTVSPAP